MATGATWAVFSLVAICQQGTMAYKRWYISVNSKSSTSFPECTYVATTKHDTGG
jgi:hypothetical protein